MIRWVYRLAAALLTTRGLLTRKPVTGWPVAGLLFALATTAHAETLPHLVGRVNDYANVLTPDQKQTLETSLEELEKQQGHLQLVLLTTRNMNGMAIEDYSLAVARAWKIGQEKSNNGLLITTFVAPGKEFRVRLEVGYGLEGLIPDAKARAIYEQAMRPYFKVEGHEDYMKAYTGAIRAIKALMQGEPTGDPLIDRAAEIEQQSSSFTIILLLGCLVAFRAGYIHLWVSGAVGSATAILLGLNVGLGVVGLLFFMIMGFFGGMSAHFIGLVFFSTNSSSSNGRGRYWGGGPGGFNGGSGGFTGGGGSFGGGGYSGGR